jgi:hypothetical protein
MRKHRLPTPLNEDKINERIALLKEIAGSTTKKRLLKLNSQIKALEERLLILRAPEEWRRMIYAISNEAVRIKVACIVWWDYFGSRSTENRWTHLDELVNQCRGNLSFDKSLATKALVKLGYSLNEAERRANVKTYLPLVPLLGESLKKEG